MSLLKLPGKSRYIGTGILSFNVVGNVGFLTILSQSMKPTDRLFLFPDQSTETENGIGQPLFDLSC
jgi:hypothetical protein